MEIIHTIWGTIGDKKLSQHLARPHKPKRRHEQPFDNAIRAAEEAIEMIDRDMLDNP